MNDLISRQAAIDAVRASTLKYTGFMEMEMYTDDDAVEAINGVPSAQRWIPVTERLPNQNEQFLVQYEDGQMDVARCSDVNPFWPNLKTDWHWVGTVQFAEVVAWMPLPEP